MVALLASCSQPPASREDDTPKSPPREFSAQDKKIAQALSVGNDSTVENADGPYDQALLCRNAIETIIGRLVDSGRAGGEVLGTLRQAQEVFDTRLRSLATSEGKSQNDLRRDIRDAAEQNVSSSTASRLVLGCFKNLQQTT